MENNYCLYWLHYPSFSDPKTEGYIGITSDLDRRIVEHTNYTKYAHIKNRIASGAIFTIIHSSLTKQQAEELEKQYRPEENIGWNIAKGGNIPPSRKNKISPKVLLTGDDRTESQRLSAHKHSERMKNRKPSNSIPVVLFGKEYASIREALTDLKWSGSHYYKYKELVSSGMSFDTPEQLKEYTWKLKNEKISKTRKQKGYHYNQYTGKK